MLFSPFLQAITATSLILLSATLVRADTVQGRYTAGCALIETTIYCYGGQNSPTVTNFTILEENLFNSFSVAEDMTVENLQNSWKPIQRDHLGPLYFFAMAAVPDQKSILVDGGGVMESAGYRPKYTTTMYDVTTEDWATDLIDGHPAVSLHTAVVGHDDTVYIWGGVHYPVDYIAKNLSITHPLDMFLFDLTKKRWTQSNNIPTFLQSNRARNAAVLGADGMTIYYVGGMIPDSPQDASGTEYFYNPAPMNEIITFNSSDLTWNTWNTSGTITPTTRSGHTLTLNPVSNEIILLGGYDPFAQGDFHRSDYCYGLNTTTREWRPISIGADAGATHTAEGIFGHSVVLVGKYLFVIFGSVPPLGAPTSDIRVINMETMTWSASFTAPPVPSEAPGEVSSGSKSNAGTIAGAVVGAVVGVGLIAGLIAFFLIRRRRQSKGKKEDSSPEKDHMVPPPPAYVPPPQRQSEEYYAAGRPSSPFSQQQCEFHDLFEIQ
ncbi:hypothetical protein BJV82DRAFT_636233 [Fennellomyces sp. T-0311]|nr:hypothetical protein BJV82DRAFT_636233 [Fennellomyces sp. T-0311]